MLQINRSVKFALLVMLIIATACTPKLIITDKRVVTRQDKIVALNDNFLERQPEKQTLTENPFTTLLGPIHAPDDLSVRPCEGEAPLLCVYRGTMVLGSIELATFPLANHRDFQKMLSDAGISLGSANYTSSEYAPQVHRVLAMHAAAYLTDVLQDRGATYQEGHTFTPIAQEETLIGDLPGLNYGFIGIDQEGRIFERCLNYAAFDNDTLYLFGMFYTNGMHGSFISDEELLHFEPYLRQTLAGIRLPVSEDWYSPGAELPPGPRVVIQRPDNSIQYVVSPDGTSAVLATDASASLVPAGFDRLPMTDGPAIFIRQMWGGFYVLDTLLGNLIPLNFVPFSASSVAVRPITEEAIPEGQVVTADWDISLAWGELTDSHKNTTSHLFLTTQDGSRKILALEEVFESSDTWTQFVPWRWGREGRLYFSKQPGMGGFFPFMNVSNLWVYDLRDGSSKELVSDVMTAGKLCLGAISPDDRLVAHHCKEGQITLLDLETGTTTDISLPDQAPSDAHIGSIRFSPDGLRIAFAMMTGGFELIEETQGYIAVSESLSGSSHIIATSEVGEWFSIAEWLWGSGDILVLQSHNADPNGWPAVWTVQVDGSELIKLANGTYLEAAY